MKIDREGGTEKRAVETDGAVYLKSSVYISTQDVALRTWLEWRGPPRYVLFKKIVMFQCMPAHRFTCPSGTDVGGGYTP